MQATKQKEIDGIVMELEKAIQAVFKRDHSQPKNAMELVALACVSGESNFINYKFLEEAIENYIPNLLCRKPGVKPEEAITTQDLVDYILSYRKQKH
jgi:hypothetical protein